MNQIDAEDDFAELRPHVDALLQAAGSEGGHRIRELPSGRNSRVFRVAAHRPAALKWYYTHSGDDRDRLQSEYAFCQFCWEHGIDSVPQPLAVNRSEHLALYEWIDGRRVAIDQVSRYLNQALQFILKLNHHGDSPRAAQLPRAAEACFRISEHLTCVQQRVDRLRQIGATNQTAQRAADFVARQLVPIWQRVSATVDRSDSESPLEKHDQCVSPSDFGFHNALVTRDGHVRFLDFEYAGWDDPAKLVCDFFCQIEVPIPLQHWDTTVASLAELAVDADRFRSRCEQLLPVYQIKWACIVLNEFLPEHAARRRFSSSKPLTDEQMDRQLERAKEILASIR